MFIGCSATPGWQRCVCGVLEMMMPEWSTDNQWQWQQKTKRTTNTMTRALTTQFTTHNFRNRKPRFATAMVPKISVICGICSLQLMAYFALYLILSLSLSLSLTLGDCHYIEMWCAPPLSLWSVYSIEITRMRTICGQQSPRTHALCTHNKGAIAMDFQS